VTTKRIMLMGVVVFALVGGTVLCHAQDASKPANDSHKAYVVAPSYDYELSGLRTLIGVLSSYGPAAHP